MSCVGRLLSLVRARLSTAEDTAHKHTLSGFKVWQSGGFSVAAVAAAKLADGLLPSFFSCCSSAILVVLNRFPLSSPFFCENKFKAFTVAFGSNRIFWLKRGAAKKIG